MNNRYALRKAILLMVSLMLLAGCGKEDTKTSEAMAFVEGREYQQALTKLEEAKAMQEDPKLIARGQGMAYLGMGEYDQAIASFYEALSYSDGYIENADYDINLFLGTAFCKKGQYEEAKGVYDAVLALQPEKKEALFQRGNVFLMTDQFVEAQKDFEKLISIAPTDFDMLIQIYECLDHFGYKDLGRTYLMDALENNQNKMSEYDKGRVYFYLEQYQQAYLCLESAKDKGGAKASLLLGKSYEATGDLDYAIRVYQGFLEKEGEDAGIYNQLGMCYMKKAEFSSALEYLEKGLELGEQEYQASLQYNEAVCYEYLQEYDKAKELFGQYLKIVPEDDKARREYEFLSTR